MQPSFQRAQNGKSTTRTDNHGPTGRRSNSFFRKSHSLTQAELAERSDVDDITISRLETGARAPSIDQLERLASVFEVPISQLLNETEVPSSERGKMLASMLGSLSNEQQAFVVELVRLYVEAHGKKSRPR